MDRARRRRPPRRRQSPRHRASRRPSTTWPCCSARRRPPAPDAELAAHPVREPEAADAAAVRQAAADHLQGRHVRRQERDLHDRQRSDPARPGRMSAERRAVPGDRPQGRADRAAGIPRHRRPGDHQLRTEGRQHHLEQGHQARRSASVCRRVPKAGRELLRTGRPARGAPGLHATSQSGVLVFAQHVHLPPARYTAPARAAAALSQQIS